ncbi:hypothetical protein ACFFX0_14690 [Citricoccus parietis]|uniref:Uncharacterized protein n=1 Tax=Citricoccus parietis TaxID=592307 RepID=A0ABV5G0B8_9MICC
MTGYPARCPPENRSHAPATPAATAILPCHSDNPWGWAGWPSSAARNKPEWAVPSVGPPWFPASRSAILAPSAPPWSDLDNRSATEECY